MAFLQSNPPRQPIFRAPGVVLWLIAALVGAHALRAMAAPAQSDAMIARFAFIPARYVHGVDLGPIWDKVVSFVSYMGLHNDFTHVGINCLWLLAFGPVVARRFGGVLFLFFFIVCGVAGAATHLAFNWGSPVAVIGASAGVSGLMGAALRMLPAQTPWAIPGEVPLAPLLSRPVLVFTLVWGVINVAAGLTGFGMGGEGGLAAWQAHFGGYFAGLLLCGPFDALRPRGDGVPLDH